MMYKIQVNSSSSSEWMTAIGCDDGYATHADAVWALRCSEDQDPGFKFRIALTAFGSYWREVYGVKTAEELCSEYGLSDRDLDEWVSAAEVGAAQQVSAAHWEAIQAEWCQLGFSKRALTLLQEAEEAIHQAAVEAGAA
jgi:hypothetical protein